MLLPNCAKFWAWLIEGAEKAAQETGLQACEDRNVATGRRERCYRPIPRRIIGGKIRDIWSVHGNAPQRLGRGLPRDSLIWAFSESPTITCFERLEPDSARARRLCAPSRWADGSP